MADRKICRGLLGVLLAGVALAAPAPGRAQAAPMLVENGRAAAEIVTAGNPARLARLAAVELQEYVEKISGAKLPIVNEPSGAAIPVFVGVSRHTEHLGLEVGDLAYGAFRIAARRANFAGGETWLALLGNDRDFDPDAREPWGQSRRQDEAARINRAWDEIAGDTFRNPFYSMYMWYNPEFDFWEFDDRGTLNAVHEFLRGLGVRWYLPGELGEVVPRLADIPLPAESRTVRPDFAVRRLNWYSQHRPVSADDARWRLRLGLHQGHDVIGITQTCHGMKFVHGRDEMKQAHPELYARRGEVRVTEHKGDGVPCLSAGVTFEKHVGYARAVFDQFDEPMISIDLVDGFGGAACDCPACRAQVTSERGWRGSLSDYAWGYLERVARALYESHPDRFVSGLTYSSYQLPPTTVERMPPNFVLFMLPPRMSFHDPVEREAFDHLLADWRAKLSSGRICVWSSISYNNRGREDRPLLPVYIHHALAGHVRALKGVSIGEQIECYEHNPNLEHDWHAQAVAHLALYTYARAWWDADLDLDAMLEEYYALFYGPAAREMKAFIEYCEHNWPRMRTDPAPIDRAFALIAAARAAVEPESVYGRRVAMVADYLELARPLREQLSAEREGPEVRLPVRPAAALALDGRLDDPFWEGVPSLTMVAHRSGDEPRAATTARLAWADNDSLVIGIRCAEPDMAGLLDTADGAAGVFRGDYVDLLLETPVHLYYQVTVSPSGALLDMDRGRGFDTAWRSQAEVAAHRGEDYWSVELRLPAAGENARETAPELGIAGGRPRAEAPWYFNLCRSRPRAESEEVSVLAPTGGRHFHDRFRFGRLVVE